MEGVLTQQSQAKKVGIINKLLSACQGTEAKFIVRSLEGKLRIGLADRTLVSAIAHAIVLRDLGKSGSEEWNFLAQASQAIASCPQRSSLRRWSRAPRRSSRSTGELGF